MKRLPVLTVLMLLAVPAVAQVTFEWDSYPMACSGFKLYETTTPGVYTTTPVATITPCTQTRVTLALPSPGVYYYRLTAFDATRESTPSNEVTVSIPVPPLPPPSTLRVTNLIVSIERKNAVLAADANLPATLQFFYGRPGQAMKPATVNATSPTHGQVQLTRLSPRTRYAYQWSAVANGQTATAAGEFTTR